MSSVVKKNECDIDGIAIGIFIFTPYKLACIQYDLHRNLKFAMKRLMISGDANKTSPMNTASSKRQGMDLLFLAPGTPSRVGLLC
jgi:hypothetical protein